jgi:hypothetical protein
MLMLKRMVMRSIATDFSVSLVPLRIRSIHSQQVVIPRDRNRMQVRGKPRVRRRGKQNQSLARQRTSRHHQKEQTGGGASKPRPYRRAQNLDHF